MDKVKPGDKERVLLWLQKYAHGYRNARTRDKILPYMGSMSDRYWRLCVSELIHAGQIFSSASRGYWFLPEVTTDAEEVAVALESLQERQSKALDMLTGLNRQIDTLEDRKRSLTQQITLDFTAKVENGVGKYA